MYNGDGRNAVNVHKNYTADQGDADALFTLGTLYFDGDIVEEDDERAVELFRLAAEQDDENAMEMLGYCYENGYGVAEDLEQAIHWYQQAAERGDEEAKASLERLAVEREAEIRTNN